MRRLEEIQKEISLAESTLKHYDMEYAGKKIDAMTYTGLKYHCEGVITGLKFAIGEIGQ